MAVIFQTLQVKSDSGKTYEIKAGKDGNVYCTCPSWRFMGGPVEKRVCKHMKEAASLLRG